MKRIHLFYISIILLFSFLIISLYFFFTPKTDNEMPVLSTNIDKEKIVYLTFDDGPSENSEQILDILEKYEIQATFFVVGPSYKLKNDLLKSINNKGHKIAIHSYSHKYSTIYENEQSFINDFFECANWIKKTINIEPTLYRFPGGSSTTITSKNQIQSIIKILDNQGYTHVDWNVDSFDSHYNNDYDEIIKSTINYIKLNESNNIYNQIILMHDNKKKEATIKALPYVIEYCLSKGYKFKILNEESYLIQHVKKPI